MIELQQNRYLWVHFAGLAFVPLLLDVCLAGLASAGPALPFGWQFWAIALLGILPALAMQWLKPFYIFSLPPSALRPAALTEDQRRCLQIFKSWQIKALAVLVAAFSLWLLVKIYVMLPQVSPMLKPRAGLFWGAIAFFIASTFMQISVSAGRALLIGPDALKRVPAVEEGAIATDFLILGIRLNKLLPESAPLESKELELEEKESKDIKLEEQLKEPEIDEPKIEAPEIEELKPEESEEDSDKPTQAVHESTTSEIEPNSVLLESEALSEEIPENTEPTDESDEPTEVLESTVDKPALDEDDEIEVIIPEKLPPEPEEDFPTTE
ncbi:low-complexity tail membrane protein [cf. Phormidesmis sp. LEGE 11477]|uniref:low-complexity tail membrane protein n=1 Tax=cf. Phormidesmis sp. LEGE 11477 TaxID=1828680 RepID=UPI00187E43B0|nr:low-complexity tail membrane protein [cf. Phormidesmis sp. LEGE 11477]